MSLPFDQVSYLFLCIQNTGGKIDFNGVARDYERIHGQNLSKGAAERRFARLKFKMEGMGMGATNGTPTKTPTPKKRKSDDTPQKKEEKKVKREFKEESDEE